ncbi:MAG: hypothetical protein ABI744_07385 [Chloroflexota bacterium]
MNEDLRLWPIEADGGLQFSSAAEVLDRKRRTKTNESHKSRAQTEVFSGSMPFTARDSLNATHTMPLRINAAPTI